MNWNKLTDLELTQLPYADFFVGNAKKNPHEGLPAIHVETAEDYLAVAEKTGKHYSRFLGRTFAITSYLTYAMVVKLERGTAISQAHTTATVLSWRVLYEGIGLSGWTPDAEELAKDVGSIGGNNAIRIDGAEFSELGANGYEVYQVGEDESARYYVKGVSAMRYAWLKATEVELDTEVAQYLYWGVLITHAYSALERELDEQTTPEAVLEAEGEHLVPFLRPALIYGTLRRGSKGLAVGAAVNDNGHNRLYAHLTAEHLDSVGNGVVRGMLESLIAVHELTDMVDEAIEAKAQSGQN